MPQTAPLLNTNVLVQLGEYRDDKCDTDLQWN